MIPGLTADEEIEWVEWGVHGGVMPRSMARLFWTEQERLADSLIENAITGLSEMVGRRRIPSRAMVLGEWPVARYMLADEPLRPCDVVPYQIRSEVVGPYQINYKEPGQRA